MRKFIVNAVVLLFAIWFPVVNALQLGDPTNTRILKACAVPIALAPSGTVNANGAVVLGTALRQTYSSGIWLYFPANAVASGSSAGFFWTVMSDTTNGTIYNSTYTVTSICQVGSTSTAISDAGPGAYTGVTSATTMVSVSAPGGFIGKNGYMSIVMMVTTTNNANAKTIAWTYGGSTIYSASHASLVGSRTHIYMMAAGNTSNEIAGSNAVGGIAGAGGPNNYIAVDSTSSQTVAMSITRATATDLFNLDGYVIEYITSQ